MANLKAVQSAWDLFTLNYTPTHAGEEFTAQPFIYTEGTYDFGAPSSIIYYDQPAYLSYADGEFLIAGTGEGAFQITANSGDFGVSYFTPGVQNYTTFTMRNTPTNFFLLERNEPYTVDNVKSLWSVYINTRSVSHGYNSTVNQDGFVAFKYTGGGIGNMTGYWTRLQTYTVPLTPGTKYTYDDALQIYIDYFNDVDTNLNLTLNDFPDEDSYLPTEPTEPPTEPGATLPPGIGFDFDYGEVISPTELDSILDQETYEVDTIQDFTMPVLSLEESMELQPVDHAPLKVAGGLISESTEFFKAVPMFQFFFPLVILSIVVAAIRKR